MFDFQEDPSQLEGGPEDCSRKHVRPGFVAHFEQYLERTKIDLLKDGVGYRQVVLNLTDEEISEMAGALNAAVGRFLTYDPKPGRKRRMLATVLIPVDDGPERS